MAPSLITYGAAALAVASGVVSQQLTYQLKESFTPSNFFDDDKWEFFVVCSPSLAAGAGWFADGIKRPNLGGPLRRETRPTALSTTKARTPRWPKA